MKKKWLFTATFFIAVVLLLGYFYFPLPNHKDYTLYSYRKIQKEFQDGSRGGLEMERKIFDPTDDQIVAFVDNWAKSDFNSDQIYSMNDQITVLGLNRPKIVLSEMAKLLKANTDTNPLSPKTVHAIQIIIDYIQQNQKALQTR